MGSAAPLPVSQALSRSWDVLRRPIWMFDPHALRGVYANAAALRLWDADSPEELLSRDFSKLSPAVQARTRRLAEATAEGEAVSERWTFYPKGVPVTVQATISTFVLDDGRQVLLFEAAPADVEAEERRAVEALRHTSTLITLFDAEGLATFANPAAYAAYGSSEHPFAARFADPGRASAMLAQALGGATVAEVCEIFTLQGRRWHHLDARPVRDPVTGVMGVLLNELDVTERVEAERGRAAAEQKAAMAEARQRFLTDMSHELRTPLNTVIGFSQLLQDAGLESVAAGQAGRIHEAGKALAAVVNEMIRLSESEAWGDATAIASETWVPQPPAALSPQPPPGRALRVLYADDNENNRALVTSILTAYGVDCQTAVDGARAVEAARTGDWDVVLMDVQMPVMDGIEATAAIRALAGPAGDVPVLALTANTLAEQLDAYTRAGMDDVIAKPIDISLLVAKVLAWSKPRAQGPAAEPARGAA